MTNVSYTCTGGDNQVRIIAYYCCGDVYIYVRFLLAVCTCHSDKIRIN
jgi:hypothetical protein